MWYTVNGRWNFMCNSVCVEKHTHRITYLNVVSFYFLVLASITCLFCSFTLISLVLASFITVHLLWHSSLLLSYSVFVSWFFTPLCSFSWCRRSELCSQTWSWWSCASIGYRCWRWTRIRFMKGVGCVKNSSGRWREVEKVIMKQRQWKYIYSK